MPDLATPIESEKWIGLANLNYGIWRWGCVYDVKLLVTSDTRGMLRCTAENVLLKVQATFSIMPRGRSASTRKWVYMQASYIRSHISE